MGFSAERGSVCFYLLPQRRGGGRAMGSESSRPTPASIPSPRPSLLPFSSRSRGCPIPMLGEGWKHSRELNPVYDVLFYRRRGCVF